MFLTVDEAAVELGVTPGTVREWAKKGRIPARRFGRLWRFDKNEINDAGKVEACPSIAIQSPLIGGYASRSAVEKFAKRQGQKTARLPKNLNTSCAKGTGVKLALVSSTTVGKKRENGG